MSVPVFLSVFVCVSVCVSVYLCVCAFACFLYVSYPVHVCDKN